MDAVSNDPGPGVSPNSTSTHRAVVLVAVLGLLALLLLLVTTLSLVSRVDTTVGLAQDRQTEARRHALVALEQARAHLQVAAGPDQRVTATSGWQGGGLPGSRSLTGVWATDGASPRLVTWLVSGNAPEAAPDVTPQTVPAPEGPPGPDEVLLVDRATVSRDQDRVKLRRQPLRVPERLFPGGDRVEAGAVRTVGHVAYWVGDDGGKASLALAAGAALPDYDNRSESGEMPAGFVRGERWASDLYDRMRLAQSVPRRPRFEAHFPGFDPLADGVPDRLARVLTREQLAFVRPELTPARVRAAFGAVTPVSRAVLADTARGGLKRDASDLPSVASPVLRRYLSERPVLFDGSRPVHRLQPLLEDPPGSRGEPDLVFSVGPVVTEYLVRFRVVRDPESGRVGLGYEQHVELWNPYTAILEAEPGELVVQAGHLPRLTLATPSGAAEVDLNEVVAAGSTAAVERWMPGEVRVLRGAAQMGSEPTEGRWYPRDALTVPAGIGPLQVELRVEPVPAAHPVAVETRVRGHPLATVRPAQEFAAGDWLVDVELAGNALFNALHDLKHMPPGQLRNRLLRNWNFGKLARKNLHRQKVAGGKPGHARKLDPKVSGEPVNDLGPPGSFLQSGEDNLPRLPVSFDDDGIGCQDGPNAGAAEVHLDLPQCDSVVRGQGGRRRRNGKDGVGTGTPTRDPHVVVGFSRLSGLGRHGSLGRRTF